ncbi:MAG: hypothetical protein ACOCW6_10855 [Spirochaetota bacterium]
MARHRFEPSLYYPTLGSHEPVLRVADGDAIATSTLDAHGSNAREEVVAEGPNPMTGPFFVEGAEPGDTLVVTLDRLERPGTRPECRRSGGDSRSTLVDFTLPLSPMVGCVGVAPPGTGRLAGPGSKSPSTSSLLFVSKTDSIPSVPGFFSGR